MKKTATVMAPTDEAVTATSVVKAVAVTMALQAATATSVLKAVAVTKALKTARRNTPSGLICQKRKRKTKTKRKRRRVCETTSAQPEKMAQSFWA